MFILCFFISCEDDDNQINDSNAPSVENFITDISSAPGLELFFTGLLTDDLGLKSINLKYDDWFLNKTILVDNNATQYELSYKFLVPADEILGSSHTITINITDLGNNLITREVNVLLDDDQTNPEIEIISPLSGSFYETGSEIPIEIHVSDNFQLETLQIASSDLNYNEKVDLSTSETEFTYTNSIIVPDNLEGNVSIEATVIDAKGNSQTTNINFNVGAEVVYENMYLTGGSTWFGNDATKAMRMLQDANDEDWFEIDFFYTSGSNIKFVAQLGLTPNNWGLDPNDNSQIINSPNSLGIGFPEGSGYYKLRFNPYALQYTYQTLTVNTQLRNEMYVMGKGYVGSNLDWNPADGIPMVQNPNNPYQFSVDLEFSDSVDLKFLGQNTGWGPYDCGFVNGGESNLPINYIENLEGDGTPDIKFNGQPGNYRIIFDYYLLRTGIQPVN